MLYLSYYHFASNQRLLYPLPLLMFDAYHLQAVWLAYLLSYPALDNTSNISIGSLISSQRNDVVHRYVWCNNVMGNSLQVLCILDGRT